MVLEKSTLLKILDGSILPDEGEVLRQSNLIIGRLVQEVPNELNLDIRTVWSRKATRYWAPP